MEYYCLVACWLVSQLAADDEPALAATQAVLVGLITPLLLGLDLDTSSDVA